MELPLCVNFAKRRGCERSAVILSGEGDDHWTFHCETCKLIFVVSKPPTIVRSRLRQQEEAIRRRIEERRKRDSRRKIFA